MPYYVFNNFVTYLNEIIEQENKNESGGNHDSGNFNSMVGSMQRSMKNTMSGMGNMKLPK